LPRTRSVELRGKVLAGGKTLQLEGKHFAIAATLWAVALAPALSRAVESSGPDRFDTVVVDAGHGGDDVGARGAEGLLEKELVLDIAHRLAKRFSANGLKVVLTRRDETSIANDARADLFISIHANATHDTQVRGIETFFLSLDASDDHAGQVARRENQAFHANDAPAKRSNDALVAIIGDLITNQHMEESNEFARLAQLELAGDPQVARGVKQAPFVVLEGVQMPAALVEIGFLTNRLDERLLRGTEERDRIVAALVRSALEFGRRYDARRGVGSR